MRTCLLACLLLLATLPAPAQLLNGGFETWQDTAAHAYPAEMAGYGVNDAVMAKATYWEPSSIYGSTQTGGAYSGDYALILHNWYLYLWTQAIYTQPLTTQPTALEGYFRYAENVNQGDTSFGGCTVIVQNAQRMVIGSGSLTFRNTPGWTAFQVPITYTSSDTPDSIRIEFYNSDQVCDGGNVCSLLWLDELSLRTAPTATAPASACETSARLLPGNRLHVSACPHAPGALRLLNLHGQPLLETSLQAGAQEIALPSLPGGIYLVHTQSGTHTAVQRLWIP